MITLEEALSLIPDKKSDLVSAFDLLSSNLGTCSNDIYVKNKRRVLDIIATIDNNNVKRFFDHIYSNVIQVGSYYHPRVDRIEESPYLEWKDKEGMLVEGARC